MHQNSMIMEVEVEHDGTVHKAVYFVEDGTIYANIEGRIMMTLTGPAPPVQTVKALLSSHLKRRASSLG